MAPAQQSGPDSNRIVVHHLSDVRHTDSGKDGSRTSILTRYDRYLKDPRLASERRPDFVVITGDLTANGTSTELNAVAGILRTCFSDWEDNLRERVVVVPGPHDINWESADGVGLKAFYEMFSDFATPNSAPAIGWRGVQPNRQKTCIAYPLDTCYSSDDLIPDLKNRFKADVADYGKFLDGRAKLGRRRLWLWKSSRRDQARKDALLRLREQYLKLTEGARQFDLYAGRVTASDVELFKRWSDQLQSGGASATNAAPEPGETAIPPLKMLISHHPIDIRDEKVSAGAETQSTQSSFNQVADAVRAGGFHLALHGHVHKPELFSEQAVFGGTNGQRPLRQLGAASLGDTGCFNEITATYRNEQEAGAWKLDVRLVNLKSVDPVISSSFEMSNPAGVESRVQQLQNSVKLRSEFELKLRYAMRWFSEDVDQSRPVNRPTQPTPPLPQGGLLRVQDAVETIFDDCDTRVRLLLKSKEDRSTPIPRLVPTYLDPVIMDGPDTLIYPASVAAWALVLGRTLTFPDITKAVTEPEDHEWLRRAKKLPKLLEALAALEASATAANDGNAARRYESLIADLNTIGLSSGQSDPQIKIKGETFFQTSPGTNPPRSYPAFICVPYPLRAAGGALPTVPEMAVLDIGVRPKVNAEKQDSAPMPVVPFNPFTKERIEMLETLSELIGLILVASDALGKPPGVWHDPR